MVSELEPFVRHEQVDEPSIAGATWWHEGLVAEDRTSRRTMVLGLLAGAGVAVTGIALIAKAAAGEKTSVISKAALEIQKEYGWNFGATDATVQFPQAGSYFRVDRLQALSDARLKPTLAPYEPWFVPTLFQSTLAMPINMPRGDEATSHPVGNELQAGVTASMQWAYEVGLAFGHLFADPPPHVAVIVDLPGADAVAFAAGARPDLDPIFAFDNWPHPHGVVASHLTLAAAAIYYDQLNDAPEQSLVAGQPTPMFVLDRNRLADYTSSATQFDNRYLARLPSAAKLSALGIKYVMYVCPSAAYPIELDDLNALFVQYQSAGVTVRALGLDAFRLPDLPKQLVPKPTSYGSTGLAATCWYGGNEATSAWFWQDYPWGAPHVVAPALLAAGAPSSGVSTAGPTYVAKPRTTTFTTKLASSGGNQPTDFAVVPVVIAASTGLILGAQMSRNGSWNRTSGSGSSYGGGG